MPQPCKVLNNVRFAGGFAAKRRCTDWSLLSFKLEVEIQVRRTAVLLHGHEAVACIPSPDTCLLHVIALLVLAHASDGRVYLMNNASPLPCFASFARPKLAEANQR